MFTSAGKSTTMAPMTATVTQVAAEDQDQHRRHRHQRHRAQQHRDRHQRVLGALAQLEQRGREDRGDQARDEPDERVAQRDHEVAHDQLPVRRGSGHGEEVVPDIDRTLGDERRDLEDPQDADPDRQGGDEGQDEVSTLQPRARRTFAGRGAADVAAQVRGGRHRGLQFGGGGQRGHHFPFDQGVMPRATRPSSMKPSSATAPLARARPRRAERWSSAGRGSWRCRRRTRSSRSTRRAPRRGTRPAPRSAAR